MEGPLGFKKPNKVENNGDTMLFSPSLHFPHAEGKRKALIVQDSIAFIVALYRFLPTVIQTKSARKIVLSFYSK